MTVFTLDDFYINITYSVCIIFIIISHMIFINICTCCTLWFIVKFYTKLCIFIIRIFRWFKIIYRRGYTPLNTSPLYNLRFVEVVYNSKQNYWQLYTHPDTRVFFFLRPITMVLLRQYRSPVTVVVSSWYASLYGAV